jgi:hypothetical protein
MAAIALPFVHLREISKIRAQINIVNSDFPI